MAGLPYMPWYYKDFMVSTRSWSCTARGVYRDLLDTQWDLGQLPVSPAELQQLIGATAREWRESWQRIEPKFPIVAGARKNPRLEEHRAQVMQLTESRRKGAHIANAKRWPSDRSASTERSHSNLNSNPNINTNPNLNPKSADSALPDGQKGRAAAPEKEPWPRPESTTPEARAAAEHAMQNLRAIVRPKPVDTGEDIETKRRRVDAELAVRMSQKAQP